MPRSIMATVLLTSLILSNSEWSWWRPLGRPQGRWGGWGLFTHNSRWCCEHRGVYWCWIFFGILEIVDFLQIQNLLIFCKIRICICFAQTEYSDFLQQQNLQIICKNRLCRFFEDFYDFSEILEVFFRNLGNYRCFLLFFVKIFTYIYKFFLQTEFVVFLYKQYFLIFYKNRFCIFFSQIQFSDLLLKMNF